MPTEAQLCDAALRQRIRQLLDDGTLPATLSTHIHAGYGSGANRCAGCAQTIERSQIEYDVPLPDTSEPLHFHMGCHVLWQIECVNRLRAEAE
jgi:hypothetical protein